MKCACKHLSRGQLLPLCLHSAACPDPASTLLKWIILPCQFFPEGSTKQRNRELLWAVAFTLRNSTTKIKPPNAHGTPPPAPLLRRGPAPKEPLFVGEYGSVLCWRLQIATLDPYLLVLLAKRFLFISYLPPPTGSSSTSIFPASVTFIVNLTSSLFGHLNTVLCN